LFFVVLEAMRFGISHLESDFHIEDFDLEEASSTLSKIFPRRSSLALVLRLQKYFHLMIPDLYSERCCYCSCCCYSKHSDLRILPSLPALLILTYLVDSTIGWIGSMESSDEGFANSLEVIVDVERLVVSFRKEQVLDLATVRLRGER
jgi:hypothetical protein